MKCYIDQLADALKCRVSYQGLASQLKCTRAEISRSRCHNYSPRSFTVEGKTAVEGKPSKFNVSELRIQSRALKSLRKLLAVKPLPLP